MLRRLDEKLRAHLTVSVDFTSGSTTEIRRSPYPMVALQQLARNAVMHRTYEGTNAPVRIYWFDDRIEIINPGGPYGTVTVENFGKPGNAEQAAAMLRQLSGREHRVLSAVAIAMDEHIEVVLSTSTVRFAALSEERIHRYLLSREYLDKAGGYAIQGQAGAFVEHLSGSYSGVMGLPLFETVQLLQRFDCPTP